MKVVFNKSDAAEPYTFRFTDNDGVVILKSENYKVKKSALNGIESVKKNAVSEKRYELKTAKNGKFYFNLKSTNGQIVGTSTMFGSEVDRQKAMTLLGGDAASAVLDDQSGAVPAARKTASKAVRRPKPVNSEQLETLAPTAEKAPAAKTSEKQEAPAVAPKAAPKPKAASKPKPAAKTKPAKPSTVKEASLKKQSTAEKKSAPKSSAATTAKKEQNPKKVPVAKAGKSTAVKKTAAPKVSKVSEEKPSDTIESRNSKNVIEKEKPHGIAENLVEYIGKAASFGVSMGAKPMILFVDVVKNFYNKISK